MSSTPNRNAIGYTSEDLAKVGGADLGVGCGTPVRLAQLKLGETVLDLGCGAGIDCILAADDVGPTGAVVGVDMTPDMLAKAREGGGGGGPFGYFQNSSHDTFRVASLTPSLEFLSLLLDGGCKIPTTAAPQMCQKAIAAVAPVHITHSHKVREYESAKV